MFMEQENIRVGKEKGYKGIFTTNSNRLRLLDGCCPANFSILPRSLHLAFKLNLEN